jgi:LmbE family N-acetylglucosaminyl deacetylase
MTAAFSHRDAGTAESEWQSAFDERMPGMPELGPEFFQSLDHLIVVAAQPDDETLGAAGLLARAGASGARATVIVATSGEGSHPGTDLDAGVLARRREEETRSAVAEVDPGATIHFLRLPDGRLSEHRFSLAQAIADAAAPPASAGRPADRRGGRHRAEADQVAFAVNRDGAGDGRSDDADGDGEGERAAGERAAGERAADERASGGRASGARGNTVVVAPWAGDRHPDHAAAADAARQVAEGAGAPATGSGILVLGYPIWLWHWAAPGDAEVPWGELRALALEEAQRDAKARAIAAHSSQVLPLGEASGAGPLLHAGMLAHFARPFELFVAIAPSALTAAPDAVDTPVSDGIAAGSPSGVGDPTRGRTDVAPGELHDEGVAAGSPSGVGDATRGRTDVAPGELHGEGIAADSPPGVGELHGEGIAAGSPSGVGDATRGRTDVAPGELHDEGIAADYFDRLHASADDPWGFESRWYEERKRDILLASLPDRSYGQVLEVGSSTGVLSQALAGRASDRLVGVDVSEVAVERARRRNADLPHASFERMPVPADWPSGAFDLVVVSEVGYYLDPPDLTGLIERILGSLNPQGAVVLCHWRHPVAGRVIDGDGVHEVFAARQEFTRLARHLEEDFVLDVLVRAPGESVARREVIV